MKHIKRFLIAILFFLFQTNLIAQTATESSTSWSMDSLDIFLLIIALLLLIPLYYLSRLLIKTTNNFLHEKYVTKSLAILIFSLALIPASVYAQDAAAAAAAPAGFTFHYLRVFLIGIIITEIIAITAISYQIYAQFFEKEFDLQVENEKENKILTWWKKTNNFGTVENEKIIDTGHDYDGIRELNNKVPGWFTAAFIFTILFGIVYIWTYHIAKIKPLQDQEYQNEVEQAEIAHNKYIKESGNQTDENTLVFSSDATELKNGQQIYQANCASCHLADGGGITGPNLTDGNWLYGCSPKDVYQSIKYGRPNGMMAWGSNLSDNQIIEVMDYVHSLSGKTPKTPKAPQGPACNYSATATSAPADTSNTTKPDTTAK